MDWEREEQLAARDAAIDDRGFDQPSAAELAEDRFDRLRAENDAAAARRRELQGKRGGLQPCVNCGELSPSRWCSPGCHAAEDGVPYDFDEGDDDA